MVTLLYLLGYDRQSLKVSFSKYSFVLFFTTPHYKKIRSGYRICSKATVEGGACSGRDIVTCNLIYIGLKLK